MPRRLRSSAAQIMTVSLAMTCVGAVCTPSAATQQSARKRQSVDADLRRESEELSRLADAAAAGRQVPRDYRLAWQNDYFKAQPGTFVPFTLTFDSTADPHAGLLYVRAERTDAAPPISRQPASYAYETIFPVRIEAGPGQKGRICRGFAVPPGRYRVTAVLRDSTNGRAKRGDPERRAGVIVQDLHVPDFWTGDLTTSSVILADRLEPLLEPVPAAELDEDPYVVGSNRIHPSTDRVFNRNAELIVVFLVYNPAVTGDKQFDVQVDYHLYRKNRDGAPSPRGGEQGAAVRPGEHYVTRTNPQRFSPSLMGPRFDPQAGDPVLAGQGILLSAFEPGEYRLGITVTDLLSRRTVTRDVTFTVVGS